MTEHTPGPWSTEPTTDHNAAVRVMDEQEVTVALCYQQPFDTWKAEANARLIKAAPKMLTALEVAAEALRAYELCYKELDTVEAAIGSATGTTP